MRVWVNVRDKLPEKEGLFLCSTGSRTPFIGFFRIYKEYRTFVSPDGSNAIFKNVKFYMELPLNPVEEEKYKDKAFNSISTLKAEKNINLSERQQIFLIQVLHDSLKFGNNPNFSYQLITREAMKTELSRKGFKIKHGN